MKTPEEINEVKSISDEITKLVQGKNANVALTAMSAALCNCVVFMKIDKVTFLRIIGEQYERHRVAQKLNT